MASAMIPLLAAAVALVMLGGLMLVSERASPGLAWAAILVGAVIYLGIRVPERIRRRRAEDAELFEGRHEDRR